MFIEYPLKHANILLMKLFWVTGKETTCIDGREHRFKIEAPKPKEQHCSAIYFNRLKYVNFYWTIYVL